MADALLAIEARGQRLDGHPQVFWLLCDERQQVLAELHALARDPAGGWRPPPQPVAARDLRLVHLVHPGAGFDATVPALPAPSRRPYDGAEVLQRSEDRAEAIRARWLRAACALPLLNRALEEADDGHPALDSHSALVGLGHWMGLAAPAAWPGRPPGTANALPPIRGPEPAPVAGSSDAAATPGPPPVDPLYRQARHAVARLEDRLGRGFDATSERLAHALVALARAHGLAGIDHVVLSRRSGTVAAGENVFVIRGRLDDPAHERVAMRTDDALQGDD